MEEGVGEGGQVEEESVEGLVEGKWRSSLPLHQFLENLTGLPVLVVLTPSPAPWPIQELSPLQLILISSDEKIHSFLGKIRH